MQSIAAISASPRATAARLAACAPVTTTSAKKDRPPASGATAARNRFMPVLLSRALIAARAPRNSAKVRRASPPAGDQEAAVIGPLAALEGEQRRRNEVDDAAANACDRDSRRSGPGSVPDRATPPRVGLSRVSDAGAGMPARTRRRDSAAQIASSASAVQGKSYIGRAAIIALSRPTLAIRRACPTCSDAAADRAGATDTGARRRNSCRRQGRRCARSAPRD